MDVEPESVALSACDIGSLWALRHAFVYPELVYLVIVEATGSALAGARAHWRHLTRTGDVVEGARFAASPRSGQLQQQRLE